MQKIILGIIFSGLIFSCSLRGNEETVTLKELNQVFADREMQESMENLYSKTGEITPFKFNMCAAILKDKSVFSNTVSIPSSLLIQDISFLRLEFDAEYNTTHIEILPIEKITQETEIKQKNFKTEEALSSYLYKQIKKWENKPKILLFDIVKKEGFWEVNSRFI
ncbi:MAG: hypothetical protein N4A45_00540 [Flavobacteriales bacterium]|jgi:hypothetical protein|nr:hypothetical protein [Flavobacteriales bacterium]